VICLVLIVLHTVAGVLKFDFKVDSTTLGLLTLAALPVLWQIVARVKAGGIEVSFRELAVHQQIFKFLDGVATQRAWTFYPPRPGESELGEGLAILITNLKREHGRELIDQLELWLEADNNNLKWFAAEIIGYFKIEELKDRLPVLFQGLDPNVSWEPWQLNCLWAYSRFQNYEELNRRLQATQSESNGLWILDAYSQMVRAKDGGEIYVAKHMEKFLEREGVPPKLRVAAIKVLSEYRETEMLSPNKSFGMTAR